MLKVLIVEDNIFQNKQITNYISQKNENLKVYYIAYTYKEAISIIKKEIVDIIILDLNLPDISCSDCEPWSYPPVKATVQIREAYTGRVLASSTTGEMDLHAQVSAHVQAGTKVQIFFDVSTKDGYQRPGAYRKAHFSYYYTLY